MEGEGHVLPWPQTFRKSHWLHNHYNRKTRSNKSSSAMSLLKISMSSSMPVLSLSPPRSCLRMSSRRPMSRCTSGPASPTRSSQSNSARPQTSSWSLRKPSVKRPGNARRMVRPSSPSSSSTSSATVASLHLPRKASKFSRGLRKGNGSWKASSRPRPCFSCVFVSSLGY